MEGQGDQANHAAGGYDEQYQQQPYREENSAGFEIA